MNVSHLLYSLVHAHLPIFFFFFFFAIMSNAAMNIHIQVFFCGYMFSFLLGIYEGMELLSKSHGNPMFKT